MGSRLWCDLLGSLAPVSYGRVAAVGFGRTLLLCACVFVGANNRRAGWSPGCCACVHSVLLSDLHSRDLQVQDSCVILLCTCN